ncbi:MAG TPA: hypothetical protein VN616_08630 [Puia sp.]|nr:hypothetical protein [Puia sp.]
MKKGTIVVMLLALFGFFSTRALAQAEPSSMKNTNWKAFIEQLNDSITLHIGTDSSYVSTSNGDVVVRSVFKMSGDTLMLSDYDGQYACTGMTGKYKTTFSEDVMTTVLIEDPCEGRAGSINNLKWRKSTAPPVAAAQ